MKTHCIKCGTLHPQDSYPKKCESCGCEAYSNPLPVVIVVIPVEGGGILLERRGIEPGIGLLALPGGYMETGESIEEAGAREVREELGIEITDLKLLGVESNLKKNMVLIFLESAPITKDEVPFGLVNPEVQGVIVGESKQDLAFPAHQKYYDKRLGKSGL